MMKIDPDKNYSIVEACRLLPSSLPGKTLHPITFRRWRREGKIQAIKLGERYFVPGTELLRLLSRN